MSSAAFNPLDAFCHNLTLLAQTQPFSAQFMYAVEIARAVEILARRYGPQQRLAKKCNPVLIGEDAAERWQALEGAITALRSEDAPASLRGTVILSLDFEALMVGVDAQALIEEHHSISARYPSHYRFDDLARDANLRTIFQQHMRDREAWRRGNVAYQRLHAILSAVVQSAHLTILVVDPLHRLFGGDFERYPFDMRSDLKPLFARRQIQLWGSCTLAEYRHVERDASLQRRFAEICLPTTIAMLMREIPPTR